MDIFDNAINKRIMGGSFPTDKLYSASIESDREIDFTGYTYKEIQGKGG